MKSDHTNLVVDQGNSICKWAFFEQSAKQHAGKTSTSLSAEPLAIYYTKDPHALLSEDVLTQYRPQACIYSSVLNHSDDLKIRLLEQKMAFFCCFDAKTPIPIRNNYNQPESLGSDRLAAAVGAWTIAPGRSALIIDLGTAITYDLLTASGVYEGGNIAPGIYLRLKALHENTKALPMPEIESEDFPEFGRDTISAIKAGVLQGIFHEINGYRIQHQLEHPELITFLTGGDLIYFVKKLKSGIFARPNLVLTGLHRILLDYVNV